jgi:heme-degrading monooxygenase HmoA
MHPEGGKPMICRVALHEKTPGSVASDEARGFREWIKELPGFVSGYHVQDSTTGRMLSITIWDSQESMEALRDLTPQGGSLGIRTDREELFDVVEKY